MSAKEFVVIVRSNVEGPKLVTDLVSKKEAQRKATEILQQGVGVKAQVAQVIMELNP